ncbi:helix-turn-helix domain-containing protein [Corynebacterium sp. zg-915]|uniref:Helix-turn-helix domain-containing protein n=1 Tax=Corynebacterium wankanglinii TaxID=2735136 RepID=A0A838CL19_9CORY|nr:helix-turn-helix domain-containing protein [Corynebacterium wankanglinii]
MRQRHREDGYEALEPRSKRPRTNPRALQESVTDRILELREELTKRGTDAGANTIRWLLQQESVDPPPAASTIHRVLAATGHITPQAQERPHSPWTRF